MIDLVDNPTGKTPSLDLVVPLITSLYNPHIHDIITEFQRVANGYNDPK